MPNSNQRPTPSPHEHTVLLGTRHMVRITKLAFQDADAGADEELVKQYVRRLTSEQVNSLEIAIRAHEFRLLSNGVPVE
jgi:hypothetical protein